MNQHIAKVEHSKNTACIYFVHGLGGKALSTWGKMPDFIASDPNFDAFDRKFFGFPTSLFRFPFSKKYPKIQTLAQALKTEIDVLADSYQEINLVAHSLGGLISRQFIVDEIKSTGTTRVNKLILYAVPNGGAGLASVGSFVSWRHNQLKQLCKNSDFLRSLNNDWHLLGAENFVSVRYVVAALDRVVDQIEAQTYWGNEFVDVIADRGHIDVVKPKTTNEISYRILQKHLGRRPIKRTEPSNDLAPQGVKEGQSGNTVFAGFAVDLSGSMQRSMNNNSGGQITRLSTLQEAISKLAKRAEETVQKIKNRSQDDTSSVSVFVQGFGLRHKDIQTCDLLTLVKESKAIQSSIDTDALIKKHTARVKKKYEREAGKYSDLEGLARSFGFGKEVDAFKENAKASAEREVRLLVLAEVGSQIASRLELSGPTTMSVKELASAWDESETPFSELEELIYGATPMVAAIQEVVERFKMEMERLPTDTQLILMVISDGEPTDGNPTAYFDELKKLGVTIISCFVTDEDVAEPRTLYRKPQKNWPEGARVMFDAASTLDLASEFALFLGRKGWSFNDGARLFVQLNHSEVLDEFIDVLIAPISEAAPHWQMPIGK